MKLMEKMKQKRMGNKGFSLIELIIVIAIMAVLLGLVGTQVLPYLQKAREAKDLQIVNSFSTAAVTAYSSHAELFTKQNYGAGLTNTTFEVTDVFATPTTVEPTYTFVNEVRTLTNYNAPGDLKAKMSSTKGKTINTIQITINFNTGTVTTQARTASGGDVVFESVESFI